MTPEEFEKRRNRAETESLIISKAEKGYRVHMATAPQNVYHVGEDLTTPTCRCPDFQIHKEDPDWRCKHIIAVVNNLERRNKLSGSFDDEERDTIQSEGSDPIPEIPPNPKRNPSRLSLKRSVSPDGKIDSLSVEFSFSADGETSQTIKDKAFCALQVQSEIVRGFLVSKPRNHPQERNPGNGSEMPVLAEMLDVRGIQTKWGRRLFISIQANGRSLRLIGSAQKLEKQLAEAGHPEYAGKLQEGMILNLPCRVVTKPSSDGRFLTVDRIVPINGPASNRSGVR